MHIFKNKGYVAWLLKGKMVVCPFCGDKRCPHVMYHGNKCQQDNGKAGDEARR